jgi:hypothetical protein
MSHVLPFVNVSVKELPVDQSTVRDVVHVVSAWFATVALATGSVPVTPELKDTFVMVLDAPLMVLFDSVSVDALPTMVSVAAGREYVFE